MMSSSTPVPSDDTRQDDHALAAWLATVAGEELLRVRESGLEGRALKDAGDLRSHELLMELLAAHRPADAVLSEEGKDDAARLASSRVWIVDPVDGTREFSEPPRDDWAVHVALWSDGDLAAAAVRPVVADHGVATPAEALRHVAAHAAQSDHAQRSHGSPRASTVCADLPLDQPDRRTGMSR